MDKAQKQTKDTFSYKWKKRDLNVSDISIERGKKWLLERYFGDDNKRNTFLAENAGKSFLDAGCGSGWSASLLLGEYLNQMEYLGVDIADAIKVGKKRFKEWNYKGSFIQGDISDMKLDREFDIIFSEGVIHHTSKPFDTFLNLVSHLKKNGIIMFYVYKKKAPIREFTDDYIRRQLEHLSNEEAFEKLIPLTKLGKILGDLNIDVQIDEDIDLLQIPKGKYNLQRLLYWYVMKIYYVEGLGAEELNFCNFDWYRPLNCFRFQPPEIEEWLIQAGLEKSRFVVEDAGISVVARKK